MTLSDMSQRRLRMAMIGGGDHAFIGPVHRVATRLGGEIDLVAGAFSRDAARSAATAAGLGIDPARSYGGHDAFFAGEGARAEADRVDFVSIVTPNDQHAAAALTAIAAGMPVFCEKPLAGSLDEARAIADAARTSGVPVGVAYTYLGYPMVREARWLMREGTIGSLTRIAVSYTQGWLSDAVEDQGNAQAAWRTDPARSGVSGCLGDIGVHAQGLSDFITGDPIARVAADVRASIRGRRLDDDAAMLFRTVGDVPGTLVASQVCTGDENRLEISIHGTLGSLRWAQEDCNRLHLVTAAGGHRILTANRDALNDPVARALCRLPGGHPEGFIEALANLYRMFGAHLRDRSADAPAFPNADDGVRSLAFVEAAIASARADGAWRAVADHDIA